MRKAVEIFFMAMAFGAVADYLASIGQNITAGLLCVAVTGVIVLRLLQSLGD